MTDLYNYRVWCEVDNKYEYVWLADTEPAPSVCPVNTNHSIDTDQTAIVDKSLEVAPTKSDGIPYSFPSPSTLGHDMCDRDIKLRTAKVDESFEDLKVDPENYKKVDWGEVNLTGCFKNSGIGAYVECDDQADANTNAILSVWDFHPTDQKESPSFITYDIRGGTLHVDKVLTAPKEEHLIFVIGAPDISVAAGGAIKFFDAYLKQYEGEKVETINPTSTVLDPTLSSAASVMRIYLYYPAGATQIHILRLITYRPQGTF